MGPLDSKADQIIPLWPRFILQGRGKHKIEPLTLISASFLPWGSEVRGEGRR